MTPAAPLEHPATWQGDALFEDPSWSRTLEASEVDALRAAAGNLGDISLDPLSPIAAEVPELRHRAGIVREGLETGPGAIRLSGFPIESMSEGTAAALFFGIASQIGTPVSQSAEGERLFRVRNEGYAADDPRARGPNSSRKLSFHTDRCDVIGFLCWRQARSGGDNQLVSSMALYNTIAERRPDLLHVLMEPFPYKRHNVDAGNALPYCLQPVFSFREGHFAANLLRVLIDRADADPRCPDLSDPQREALDYLEAVASEPGMHVRFRQEPGDLLFLNNWVTLHRRTEFEDFEDPDERRCLFRVWLSVPNSRPLDPAFRDNYGAVEAGALRGGMRPAKV